MLEQFKGKNVAISIVNGFMNTGTLIEYNDEYILLEDKTKKKLVNRKWITGIGCKD